MKLYLSCDMEGTAGVSSWKQCDPSDTHEYPRYRTAMTGEVRAAIDGARDAGAREFVINDSHWSMRNVTLDELGSGDDVRAIAGSPKPLSMVQGLDASFDAAMFTGYHAKAGDAATLSHTYSDTTVYAVTINGVACSEALLGAAFAGTHGVPLVLVTGDRTIVDEVTRAMPWVVGVAVKDPIGYTAVNTVTPAAAQSMIRIGAREAVKRIGAAKPFTFDPPFELTMETVGVEQAEFIELMPGFERIGGRAVRFTAGDYPTVMRAFIVATRMAAAAVPVS